MKKILFYAANGVGLGHLQRVRLIVEELQSKNMKIILVTPAYSPQIFGKFFHHLVKLTPLSNELLKNPSGTFNTRLANGQRFLRALKKFKPDLIVADFHFSSPFTFYAFSSAVDNVPTKSIFIWRLADIRSFRRDLKNEVVKLNYFQKIILPHGRKELKYLLPRNLFSQIESDLKFKICGSIFRKLDRNKVSFCRHKYNISSKDFLITITVGGGGRLTEGLTRGRCEESDKVINNILAIYPLLVDVIPNLKVIIITGPYFQKFNKKSSPHLRIIKFENNLPELIKLSKLVISTAGYNTCNELIQAKTPAILVPLWRGGREQFERVLFLEKKGIIKVFRGSSSIQFFNLIINCKENLDKMKINFRKFSDWQQGNNKAAKTILNLLKK